MSVYLKCERCGTTERTGSVMLFAGLTGPGIPTARPELPDGWSRPCLPTEDGELRYKDVCPSCRAALLLFMTGAPLTAEGSGADDSEQASRLMGLAPSVCHGCGHKPHDGICAARVAETGHCACMESAVPAGAVPASAHDEQDGETRD